MKDERRGRARARLPLLIATALCAAALLFAIPSLAAPSDSDSRETFNFNLGWRFSKGQGTINAGSAYKPATPVSYLPAGARPYERGYNDASWKPISLPHAYNDEDTFDRFMEKGWNGERSMYSGTAWYRKEFHVPAEYAGKKVYVVFEAARQAAEVYVNGIKLKGTYENGFIPFGYDITEYLSYGATYGFVRMLVHSGLPKTAIGDKSGFVNELYLNANDKLHCRKSLTSSSNTTAATIAKGKWTTVRYDVNMDTKNFDIYINGKRAKAGIPFPNKLPPEFANCIVFGTGSSNRAEIYIDDVRVRLL